MSERECDDCGGLLVWHDGDEVYRCHSCGAEEVAADGGTDGEETDVEQYEEKLDELNAGLLEAYAAGFAKGVEFSDADPGLNTDVNSLMEKEPVQESHYYWDGRRKPLKSWLRQEFGIETEVADDAE